VAFDLRQLRYFVAVADAGTLTAAAAAIPVAQQSLSEQIRSLERQVGAPLFLRSGRGMQLTPVGAELLADARPLLTRADRAFERVRRVAQGEQTAIHVAFLPSVGNYIVPPLVRAFARAHPHVRLTTEDAAIADLVEGLRSGRFDAALTRPPLVDDVRTERVLREPVAVVVPVDHRLASSSEVDLAALARDPWVLTPRSSWEPWHQKYDRDFAAAGFIPNVVERGSSVQSLLALVAAGVGVTRLPLSARSLRDSGVVFVPLRGDEADVVVAWVDDRPQPVVELLRAVVRDVARSSDLLAQG
jgi:DNA-binding transcriptional LysR family regulator